jgi:endonuclease/exonuclease/phosphatase (EEP) superfamily protein YafD
LIWKGVFIKNLYLRAFSVFTLFLFQSQAQAWYHRQFEVPALENSHKNLWEENAQREGLDPMGTKILIWNLYKGDKKSFRRDFLKLSHLHEILMLQEVYLDHRMTPVLKKLNHTMNFGISFLHKKKGKRIPTGTAISSQYDPSETIMLRSKHREPIARTPKVITISTYPIKNHRRELMLINIHGLNLARKKYLLKHLEDTVKYIRNHDGPILFAGDFNTRTKKRLKQVRAFFDQLGFTETEFTNGDNRMKSFGNILDLCFTRGLKIKRAYVFDQIKGSDHKAMSVTVQISDD